MIGRTIRKANLFTLLLTLILFLGLAGYANAEDKKGYLYFKLGGNSQIADSAVDSNVIFGFGGGYLVSPRCHLYFDPSLSLHWPKREDTYFEGTPLRLTSSTLLMDFNGSYAFSTFGPRKRLMPYLTGGIGFLRNGLAGTDGYYKYGIDSNISFTKNVGAGMRVMMGADQMWFVGGEFKNYFAAGQQFRVAAGSIGLIF